MKEFVRISDVNAIIDDRIKRIKDSGRTRLTPAELNLNIVRKMVNDLDMADVVVRKKGKWISHLLDDGSFWANYCSECGVYLPYGLDWKPNGCPNCFADMRGET